MEAPEAERRLAAILNADVVRYSRLMADDEEATVRTVTAWRETVELLVGQHRGRLVDFTGDNFLAEFPTALDGVVCATEIRRVLRARNADLSERRRVEFRMGLHLGDVRAEGERLFGTAVNVAARLQGLSEPGGVCISGTVRDQLRGTLELACEDLGPQEVANIPEPVRAWQVRAGAPEANVLARRRPARRAAVGGRGGDPGGRRRPGQLEDARARGFLPALADDRRAGVRQPERGSCPGVLLRRAGRGPHHAIGGLSRADRDRPELVLRLQGSGGGREAGERRARRALPGRGERPEGRQPDPDQRAAHRWPVGLPRVGADVRSRDRRPLCAAARDEPLDRRGAAAAAQADRDGAGNAPRPRERRCVGQPLSGFWRFARFNPEDHARARESFERAIELDPGWSAPYAGLAMTHYLGVVWGWADSPEASTAEAIRAAHRAIELDSRDPLAQHAIGHAYGLEGDRERMIAAFEHTMDPADPSGFSCSGLHLAMAGRPEQAIAVIEEAMRLSPQDPGMTACFRRMGYAHFAAGRYEDAIVWAKKVLDHPAPFDDAVAYRLLAASYVHLGRLDQGRLAVREAARLHPEFSLVQWRSGHTAYDPDFVERYADGLRRAGMPE